MAAYVMSLSTIYGVCLYSKKIPEEEETGILRNLRPDARAIHQRFLREE